MRVSTFLRSLRGRNCLIPRTTPVQRTSQFFPLARSSLSLFRQNKEVSHNPRRYQSSSSNDSAPRPLTDRVPSSSADALNAEQLAARRAQEPAYRITFTCKPCQNRSTHQMSKHGYHKGTVLITCPSCYARHVISDHLQIFMDKKSSLEDILEKKGTKVTKGYLEGDMEFWEDGTVYKTGSGDEPPEASVKRLT